MTRSALLSSLLLLSLSVTTGASIDSSLAVKFYRSPASPFPSGEINRRALEKNWVQDFAESSYRVRREKREFWVKAASVARDLQLSQFVYSNRSQKTYKVAGIAGASLLVSTNGGPAEWMHQSEFSPLPNDLGVAMTLTSSQLHEKPNWKSDSVLNVPAGSRLKILKFEDTWAQVSFESVGQITGWVDLHNLILKADFAAIVTTDQKNWIPVLYREGTEIVTADKKRIPLQKIKALVTKPELAISLVTDDSQNLLLRQNLTVISSDFQTWSLSKLQGHGSVYWKKNPTPTLRESQLQSGISLDELLKRDIVAVSFHPQKPNLALASAQGIFMTTDGKTWKKLKVFQNENHPVLIDSQSHLYVGSQRSQDMGKTFLPYFRLEALAPLVEQRQRSLIEKLKIRSLSLPRPGVLRMEVESNLGAVALAARTDQNFIQKWDFD